MVQAAELNLFTNTQEFKLGQEFEVNIEILAFEKTLGTDLKINYDHNQLELIKVTPGPVYPNFTNLQDLNEIQGKLYLSGAADITAGTIPNGNLVNLKFIPQKAGQTSIKVVYDPADTTSTAVIPFTGDSFNLITQPPEPLIINIKADHWWQRIFNWINDLWQELT